MSRATGRPRRVISTDSPLSTRARMVPTSRCNSLTDTGFMSYMLHDILEAVKPVHQSRSGPWSYPPGVWVEPLPQRLVLVRLEQPDQVNRHQFLQEAWRAPPTDPGRRFAGAIRQKPLQRNRLSSKNLSCSQQSVTAAAFGPRRQPESGHYLSAGCAHGEWLPRCLPPPRWDCW